jgi:predicted cupin superfamily sugar epimerase
VAPGFDFADFELARLAQLQEWQEKIASICPHWHHFLA